MAPLRRQWQDLLPEINELGEKIKTEKGKKRENLLSQLTTIIFKFTYKLANIQILDPACGSGNFLYIALRDLLDLWKEVATKASESGLPILIPYTDVSPTPEQLHGIEINIYAHQLAQATIWIGYIQWLQENGFGIPPEPILKPLYNILNMDAILAYDEEGNPYEPDWPKADVIIGNPPFLGNRKMRPELGDNYCDSLLQIYKNSIEGMPDLVCYWFEKALSYINKGTAQRAGLLATQSIRGGTNRQVLDHIKEKGDIFYGWSDRGWVLDGATVHVSIVGFDNGTEIKKSLDGQIVHQIFADLTSRVDLSNINNLLENSGISFQGVVLRGKFNITKEEAFDMLTSIGNPNAKPNSDVIKPRRTGDDIVNQSSNSYVIDFGLNLPIDQASQYVKPFEYLKKYVYPKRQEANQKIAREFWWLHWNPRKQMREALEKIDRYIATPRVSKHRIFVWLEKDILPDAQLVVFARNDDYFFGVLQSTPHEIWSRRLGTQLRDAVSGFRYTSTTTFETFPFPWPPGKEPVDDPLIFNISAAAKELVEKRDNWLNPIGASEEELKKRTLTNLYNQNPTWLQLAHEKLDKAVFSAYGWPDNLSDDEILERLLELNLERSKSR